MSPILSICITTWNRSYFLEKTLKSITCQPEFLNTDDVEVIIADNCSSDDTEKICRSFLTKFPDKIKYQRNEENIGAGRNLVVATNMATGEFIKIHNDTLIVKDGTLFKMLDLIKTNINEKPILFFNNVEGNKITRCEDLNEFIKDISYNCTWIGSFGLWRNDRENFDDLYRYADSMLPHVDILCRFFESGKKAVILNNNLFLVKAIAKKGGYNIAEVFGQNYLSILKENVKNGLLKKSVFNREKKRVLVEHISKFYFDIGGNFSFQKTGYFKFLKDYRFNLYLYFSYLRYLRKQIIYSLTHKKKHRQEELWRDFNQHNQTKSISDFDIAKVFVGNHSYGDLNVRMWGKDDGDLIIGDFVSIAGNVLFMLGGNHPYEGFSTFPFKATFLGQEHEATTKGSIIVKDDVWIGQNSMILSGVTIGQGAIVAAGSVVTKEVPPYAIVGGNPARVIKYRFEPEIIEKMLKFDFSKLDKDSILRNKDILYEKITNENVDFVLHKLLNTEENAIK